MNLSGSTIHGEKKFSGIMVIGGTVRPYKCWLRADPKSERLLPISNGFSDMVQALWNPFGMVNKLY